LKHIVDLKRAETPYLPASVKALVDQVDDGRGGFPSSSSSPAIPPPPPPHPAKRQGQRQLTRYVSDASSSVVFCGFDCQCPECMKAVEISSPEAEPAESPTSVAAEKNEAIG